MGTQVKKIAIIRYVKSHIWDWPGGPVVRTLGVHCKGRGFSAGQVVKSPPAAQCDQKKKRKKSSITLSYISLTSVPPTF